MEDTNHNSDSHELQPGLYQHYKGAIYVVYFVGYHTETHEKLIVYRSYAPPHTIWIRPYRMFISKVELPDGTMVPRFRKLTREEEDRFISQE